MNITVKRCDFCHADVRSDSEEFRLFGVLEDHVGARWDICNGCIVRAWQK